MHNAHKGSVTGCTHDVREDSALEKCAAPSELPSDRYAAAVALRAQTKEEGWFRNKGAAYATLCVSELIGNTHDTLYVFNAKMDKTVADTEEVYDALSEAIFRGVKIRVLFEEPIDEECNANSKALRLLIEAKEDGDDVDYKQADEETILKIKEILSDDYHFMVGDGHMIRIETNKEDFRAIVNYNEEAGYAEQLHTLIESTFPDTAQ